MATASTDPVTPAAPTGQRSINSAVDARVITRYLISDASPSGTTVPVTLKLKFSGNMWATSDRPGLQAGDAFTRAESAVRVRSGSESLASYDGFAVVDAVTGGTAGGAWAGKLQLFNPGFPEDGVEVDTEATLTFNATVGQWIEVDLSNRMLTFLADVGGWTGGSFFSDDGLPQLPLPDLEETFEEFESGAGFLLESEDPGVTFTVVAIPEPRGVALAAAALGAFVGLAYALNISSQRGVGDRHPTS